MAEDYTDIAHTFNLRRHAQFAQLIGWYFNRVAKKITVTGLEYLLDNPDATYVFTLPHFSETEDFLLSKTLRDHGLTGLPNRPILSIIAGDNLYFRFGSFDVGQTLSNNGAIKVYRNLPQEDQQRAMRAQLRCFTERMEKGDWFQVFPGKGRTYTGTPLAYDTAAVMSFHLASKRADKPILYVPAAITSDRVAEDVHFPIFQSYKDKRKQSIATSWDKFWYLALDLPYIGAQAFRKHALGEISINIGEPRAYTGSTATDKDRFVQKLEHDSKRLIRVTDTALFANAVRQALLDESTPSRNHVIDVISETRDCIRHEYGKTITPFPEAVIANAQEHLNRRWRRFIVDDKNGFAVKNEFILNYYANHIEHYKTPWQIEHESQS